MTSLPRFHSAHPGVDTWHGFAAGGHYDPDRLGVGPLVGVDEHLVAPGAGFDWHAHRGVHIASWVLDGALRHEDADGGTCTVRPGTFLLQSVGDGIRHRETNASDTAPLRFVQVTVLGEDPAAVRPARPPVRIGAASLDVVAGGDAGPAAGDFVVGADRVVLALPSGDRLVIRVGA